MVGHAGGVGAAIILSALAPGFGCADPATLQLSIVEARDGAPIPARVELLDSHGRPHVPDDAVRVSMECAFPPFVAPLQAAVAHRRSFVNPATNTVQFYLAGPVTMELPAGAYRLRVFLGLEYEAVNQDLLLASAEQRSLTVAMKRWIDMPARGWYSADGHLHITRLTAEDDHAIGKGMRAEDLHVANLLQMGTAKQFGVTPQYGFGDQGIHREGATLLISGQEHPRNHLWGHTVILGARAAIDHRDAYVVNQRFWRAAERHGGLAGYAHFGVGAAHDGLLVDGPTGLLSFLEVLQFELPYYDVWYELLNLGIHLTPTAGTDFPCGYYGLPGRERFYTAVEGELTRESWLAGIAAGHTFVTNGPMLELAVDGAGIGERLVLSGPGPVTISGRVRFDPGRDTVRRVELIHNGEPQPIVMAGDAGDLHFAVVREAIETGWWALRVSGQKLSEAPFAREGFWEGFFFEQIDARVSGGSSTQEIRAFRARHPERPTAAHTAPIYLEVTGTPALGQHPRARALARRALDRLDALEGRLGETRFVQQLIRNMIYTDGVPAGIINNNRAAIEQAVTKARSYYRAAAREP